MNSAGKAELLPKLKELFAATEGVDKVIDGNDGPTLGMPKPNENQGMGDLVLYAKAGYAFNNGAAIQQPGPLVLVAGAMLLFTGRYPQGVYDLVVGLQRWTLRVGAYAALMTDVYPPFRLEQGGRERSDDVLVAPARPATTPRWSRAAGWSTPPARSSPRRTRIVSPPSSNAPPASRSFRSRSSPSPSMSL